MYNSIKLGNQSNLNIKENRETTNKFLHTSTENNTTSSKTRKPLATPLVFILTQPEKGNSHREGREEIKLYQ